MKVEFKVKDKGYYVINPSARNIIKAQSEYAKSFADAIHNGILTRDAMDKKMVEQGVWSEEKEKQRTELENFISNGYDVLKIKGGIKKSAAKDLAIAMRQKRFELMFLLADKSKYELCTAEGLAERNRLNFLISVCCKNEDGTNLFKDVNDFYDKQEDEVTMEASRKFANLYAGYDEDIYKKLPENEFLLKYGFVNENLEMIDKDGKIIDEVGNQVKDEPVVEFQEFLDD